MNYFFISTKFVHFSESTRIDSIFSYDFELLVNFEKLIEIYEFKMFLYQVSTQQWIIFGLIELTVL